MQRIFYLGVTLLVFAALGACDAPREGAELRILLTDAPADEASELNVTFGAVQLVGGSEGVLSVSEAGGSFDVLELRNGETAVLGEASIPNGSYSQLRLVVEEATIIIDDVASPVTIPSGAQSGLKINIEPPLVALSGQMSVITLDFNARRVIQTGNGGYKMGPTAIRATSISGSLEGTLVDAGGVALAGGLVSVSQAGNIITETTSDDDGRFKIITLTEGNYTVTVSLEGYASQTFEVSIQANSSATLTGDGHITLRPLP